MHLDYIQVLIISWFEDTIQDRVLKFFKETQS